jgi:hypothetical protein
MPTGTWNAKGISLEKIHLVGNIMIDSLIEMLPEAKKHIPPRVPERFGLVGNVASAIERSRMAKAL